MTPDQLTTFFGWGTVLSFGVLILATLGVTGMRGVVTRIHARLFGLDEAGLAAAYFAYLANFKIAALIVFLIPWLVLRFFM